METKKINIKNFATKKETLYPISNAIYLSSYSILFTINLYNSVRGDNINPEAVCFFNGRRTILTINHRDLIDYERVNYATINIDCISDLISTMKHDEDPDAVLDTEVQTRALATPVQNTKIKNKDGEASDTALDNKVQTRALATPAPKRRVNDDKVDEEHEMLTLRRN